jgi:hypothetical protein
VREGAFAQDVRADPFGWRRKIHVVPPERTVLETLRGGIASSPAILLGALALIPLFVLSAEKGGFFPTEWYPGALFLFALLVVGVLALPSGGPPPPVLLVAVGGMVAFTAWSYATIAWADQQADAWDGANRTAMYAAAFALFALWRIRGRGAALLAGAFALGVTAIGIGQLITVHGAERPEDLFMEGRLSEPVGYVNGNVALWSAAFWPCVVFAARREVPVLLRALFAGSGVLLGGLALMGQSRGWLFALPVVVIIFLLVSPGRVRVAWALIAVGLATLAQDRERLLEGHYARSP